MSLLKTGRNAFLAALAAASCLSVAQAAAVNVNLAGWRAVAGFIQPGNSESFINLPQGSMVYGYDYDGLVYSTSGDSWLSELVLSVNDSKTALPTGWLDWSPSTTDAGGVFSGTGSWGGATGMNGPFGSSTPFITTGPSVYVTTYLAYAVPPVGIDITQGTLRIHYNAAPIPEPTTLALVGLALFGVVAVSRRRS